MGSVQAADATPAWPEPLLRPPAPYRIGAEDLLRVTVAQHPELSHAAGTHGTVAGDGTLWLPLAGPVTVAGMQPHEARHALQQALSTYVREPQVDVAVVERRSWRVTLRGACRKPGTLYPEHESATLADALAAAQPSDTSDLGRVVLTRGDQSFTLDISTHEGRRHMLHTPLVPGDDVYVPEQREAEAFVVGEVVRPGAYPVGYAQSDLASLIGRAGGLAPTTAKASDVYVVRHDAPPGKVTVFHLDARSALGLAAGRGFRVRPGDLIFAGAAGVTRWNRLVSQLLPFSGIVNNASTANYNLGRAR